MDFEFGNPIIEWRGPAPFYFVEVPAEISSEISAMATQLSYGWGVIPVSAIIGRTSFTTSLFPKNGTYLLPLKVAARKPEGLNLGDTVTVSMSLNF
jgi:hypothetical protein